MKKILLSGLIIMAIASFAKAQYHQGQLMVAGSTELTALFGKTYEKSDNHTSDKLSVTAFELTPKAAYFVMDGLALGAGLPISYNRLKAENDASQTTSSIGIEPFARYYLSAGGLYPFAHVAGLIGSKKEKTEDGNGNSHEDTYSLTGLEVGGGLAFQVSDRVAFDIMAGYSTMSSKEKENNDNNHREITNGLGIAAGITIFF